MSENLFHIVYVYQTKYHGEKLLNLFFLFSLFVPFAFITFFHNDEREKEKK